MAQQARLNIASDIVSDTSEKEMQTSSSVVPRGFSRYYVLSLLHEKSMTGKEIMEETAKRTNGSWKPSPGLVYPLLGKLLSSGLIEEVEEGRGYQITKAGQDYLAQYTEKDKELDNLLTTFTRIGVFGQLLAKDAVDGVVAVMKNFRNDISKLGDTQKARYRKFLQAEIERLDRSDKNPENKVA
ncbi:MAG: PadR family transcriptional regulator [Nitrososphaerota archaeon]|nr:PadR family transcriptional regulator [Nitrososphaerota archaeon]